MAQEGTKLRNEIQEIRDNALEQIVGGRTINYKENTYLCKDCGFTFKGKEDQNCKRCGSSNKEPAY